MDNNTGLIVVSGCPRSGTSLMMNLFRVAMGEDAVIGRSLVDEPTTPAMKYIYDKRKIAERNDMNPDGFWEMQWTVKGISYKDDKQARNASGKVVKIVSSGLLRTDPKYISKVVYMVRHPRAVGTSQERLKRFLNTDPLGKVNTPELFIKSTLWAARWFADNDVPVRLVEYDKLVSGDLQNLPEFIGDGDWNPALQVINPKLKRSESGKSNSDLWERAEYIYGLLLEKKWQEICDTADSWPKAQSQVRFFCPRRGVTTYGEQCRLCKSGDKNTIKNFARQSRLRKTDWKNEPCLWDVEFNPDHQGDRPTIEQSIADNHWKTDKWLEIRQRLRLGDKVETATKAIGIKPCNGCEERKKYLNGET